MDQKSIEYRKEILKIVQQAGRGHVGSAFSIVEIVRVMYENILRIRPEEPFWPDRDRFILSKGHGCLALYVALAYKGFFSKEDLYQFTQPDSFLGGHPDYGKIPGVEATTGSLGHGFSVGVGVALNGKLDKKDYRTYVLVGDGECQEGSIWEAAMCASKHQLNRLTVLVDRNKMQCYSSTKDVQDVEPFADKWRAFGLDVEEVDGHNVDQLRSVIQQLPKEKTKPSVVICHTVKGKGARSIESNPKWHHKSRILDEEIKDLFLELEPAQ